MSQRHALNRDVPAYCAAQFPPGTAEPLVLYDMDAGQLWQLGGVVNGLIGRGFRALSIHVSDPFYPPEACGEHRFFGAAGHRHERVAQGAERLYTAAPTAAPTAVQQQGFAVLEGAARRSVYAFLGQVGALVGSRRATLAVAVNVYRRPQTLAERIERGIVPRCHLVMSIDFAPAAPCVASEANCLIVRDRRGLQIALWHPSAQPVTLEVWPKDRPEKLERSSGRLTTHLRRHPERLHLIEAIERDGRLRRAMWADWPALRFSGAVTSAARDDAIVVAAPGSIGERLGADAGGTPPPGSVLQHRGYAFARQHISDLVSLIDKMMGNDNWRLFEGNRAATG